MRFVLAFIVGLLSGHAVADDALVRLAMPDAMRQIGFDKHLLPRFKFKTRIAVTAVAPDAPADMVLAVEADGGTRVFSDDAGAVWRVAATGEARAEEVRAFIDWLRSTPGKAAIETFAPDGVALFTTEVRSQSVAAAETVDGDTALGSRLALVHCGRCHVVDARNRMGGIGSTPSFAALRARARWSDLFLTFWTANPHPSFTQVQGYTEPFAADRPVHIAPVLMTMEELEAITAFVATIEPKDLGRQVEAN
ncbi:MAG: hypothetical protein QNJ13_04495 [Paracoccaceae bacterium]|nr:hypothetical protein [Paracoccaceae bacterium]